MKHLLLFLTLLLAFACLPMASFAKDRDRDDDWHKVQKDLNNQLKGLEQNYNIIKDRVKYMGGGRREWDGLHAVNDEINDIGARLDSGRFDPRDIRDRINHGQDDLRQIQASLDYKNKRPRGGYYQQ